MTAKTAKPRTSKVDAKARKPARRASGRQDRASTSGPSHVTAADGNVFDDLGFSPAEAENLKVRAQLMEEIRNLINDVTQVDAAQLLGVSQPRVSDLKRGKIGMFTIDALVNMLAHAGVKMRLSVSRPKNTAA